MSVRTDTGNVTIYAAPRPFSLLQPGRHPARVGEKHGLIIESSELPTELLSDIVNSRILAVDFETRGTDPTLPDNHIVGIGLAGDNFSVYVPLPDGGMPYELIDVLRNHKGIIAHNWYFDGQWLEHSYPGQVSAYLCTYMVYKMLATEGWPGQKWGLKDAQIELLGWTETNDIELSQWLVQNGYHKQNMAPLKGEMWRAPVDILGKYCILDADSTYLLYTLVLEPVLRKYPGTHEYLAGPYMHLLQQLITQRLKGMVVDLDAMRKTAADMRTKLDATDQSIDELPDVVLAMREFREARVQEFLATEPARYKKFDLGTEPVRYRKSDGAQTVSWTKWNEKRERGPEQSKNWENWVERRKAIDAGENPDYQFNIRSGDQLRWLLFERLGYESLDSTESGLPSVSTDVLAAYGPLGKALVGRSELEKQLSYVDAYIELATTRPEHTLHPSFRVPGTLTGRLSGREPNLQQMPKLKSVMSAIVARPGHVLVDLDFKALETVVAAELTEDKSLLELYSDPNKQNDIYLFTGAHIDAFREAILATGYDPYNPTAEGMAAAKKACKRERGICKTVVLACIAEGTPIRVRGKGIIPIQDVVAGDSVWDSTEWITTTGAIDKGMRKCNSMEGIQITPDHLILDTESNWNEQAYYTISEGTNTPQPFRPSKPSASWSEVWKVVGTFFRSKTWR